MKKAIKNTIMIGMAAVLLGTSAVTFRYAQLSDRVTGFPAQAPYSMNDDNFSGHGASSGFEQQTPPQQNFGKGMQGKQEEKDSQSKQQAPDSNQSPNDNQNQPQAPNDNQNQPQAPSDNQNLPQAPSDSQNSQNNKDTQNETQQAVPNKGTATDENTVEFEQLAATLNEEGTDTALTQAMPQQPARKGISPAAVLCYIFFALQIAIIMLIILYLILSKMNRLSFNQVFPDTKQQ